MTYPSSSPLCKRRLWHNSRKCYKKRHAGESRHPEPTGNTGFRVALCLHGMTKMVIATQSQGGSGDFFGSCSADLQVCCISRTKVLHYVVIARTQ